MGEEGGAAFVRTYAYSKGARHCSLWKLQGASRWPPRLRQRYIVTPHKMF